MHLKVDYMGSSVFYISSHGWFIAEIEIQSSRYFIVFIFSLNFVFCVFLLQVVNITDVLSGTSLVPVTHASVYFLHFVYAE